MAISTCKNSCGKNDVVARIFAVSSIMWER